MGYNVERKKYHFTYLYLSFPRSGFQAKRNDRRGCHGRCEIRESGQTIEAGAYKSPVEAERTGGKIGVTELTVIRWENEQTTPRQQQLALLTEVFGKPPEEWGNARQIRWNVPLRNRYFTGRERLLELLHQELAAPNQAVALSQPPGLSGLGGIGKTASVIEYVYRYGPEYEAIFWIHADSETLVSDFAYLATVLDLPVQHESEQQRIVSQVKRWLEQHGSWLLIFDNVDDLVRVSQYWPGEARGSVLLTTRSKLPAPTSSQSKWTR